MPIHYDVTKDLRFIQGFEEGIRRVTEQRIRKEASEKNLTFTISLIQNTDFDDAKIAFLVGVTAEYVKNLRNA